MRNGLWSIVVAGVCLMWVGCGQESPETDATVDGIEVTAADDSLARVLLDSTRADSVREQLIADHPDRAVALVEAMTDDLEPGTQEEYDRIPWIWRVSIALGERNNAQEMRRLLEVSLPEEDEPFREWQSVVVGGGIINGISRQGGWPRARVEQIIGDDKRLMARWERAVRLSSEMADNEEVAYPYRYDALRMIAMDAWSDARDQLVHYLSGEVNPQLQMGSISGLSDMQVGEVPDILIDHFGEYSNDRNRALALDALMRTPERTRALLDAVASNEISPDILGEDRIAQLTGSSNAEIRKRAAEIFGD